MHPALRTSTVILVTLILAATACNRPPDNFFSDEERKAPLVLKEVYRDPTKSSHIILMNGAEKPHFHDKHSFEVVLVKGANRLHLGDKVIELTPDKPVRVEKGTLHWAENSGKGYSILNVDFYPPFDGTDRRFVK
jgi:mannose-6-phosphate isomerase-like protein (cupin superfamily)